MIDFTAVRVAARPCPVPATWTRYRAHRSAPAATRCICEQRL